MSTSVIQLGGVAPLILVYDMKVCLDFYCRIVGFTLVTGADAPDYTWALIRLNNVELMMEPIYPKGQRPELPDPLRTAHHRDTVLYFGCSNIDEAYESLRASGVQLDPPRIAPYGMKQLYFTDPDGYLLCFQFPASEEMFNAWQEWYGKDYRR